MTASPVDATSAFPNSRHVQLRGRQYDRNLLETAWLHLQEADGNWMLAADTILRDRNIGWDRLTVKVYVAAAQGWTGNVMAGEVR